MISIIIPTLNEENYLPRLLKCLKEQTYKDFEIIVSDAGSTDRTLEIAKEFGCKVVSGGIPGIGRNYGAESSSNEILVFMDSDIYFESDFLKKSLDEFNKKNFDFAIPLFKNEHPKKRFKAFFFFANSYKKLMQNTRWPDGTGQLVFLKKSKFFEIGKYKNYKVAEDTDLFWRAAKEKNIKLGILHTEFVSSTRRLEKIGIFWTFTIWAMIGIAMGIGVLKTTRAQDFFTKLYGGYKGFWKL